MFKIDWDGIEKVETVETDFGFIVIYDDLLEAYLMVGASFYELYTTTFERGANVEAALKLLFESEHIAERLQVAQKTKKLLWPKDERF